AGGQGFVTEYAQAASTLAGVVFADSEESDWQRIKAGGDAGAVSLLQSSRFAFFDGAQDVLKDYQSSSAGVLGAFEDKVIKPMRDTQAVLNGYPFVTRLYTTMSAPEMTVDPEFDYNPDLPNISNLHTADQVVECNPYVEQFDAPWRITLAN